MPWPGRAVEVDPEKSTRRQKWRVCGVQFVPPAVPLSIACEGISALASRWGAGGVRFPTRRQSRHGFPRGLIQSLMNSENRPTSWSAAVRSTVLNLLAQFGRTVRARGWIYSKFPCFVAGVAYALCHRSASAVRDIGDGFCLVLIFLLLASLGHMANDLRDLDIDRLVGKVRPIARGSARQLQVMLVLLSAAVIGLATIRYGLPEGAVAAGCVLVGLAYSIPPWRLKERGYWGWVAAALAQRTLPSALGFTALDTWNATAICFCLHGLVVGIRAMVVHQLGDRANDLASGVKTVATELPPERLESLMTGVIWPAEIGLALVTTGLLAVPFPWLGLSAVVFVLWQQRGSRSRGPWALRLNDDLDQFYRVVWGGVLCLTAIGLHVARFLRPGDLS